MRKIEVRIRQIFWAITNTFQPTTNDRVTYKGNTYYIKSSFIGDNIWNLFDQNNDKPTHRYIPGKDLKIKHSFRRFLIRFKGHLNFQIVNWESIDVRNPIGSRLSFINSDNIYFYQHS